MISFVIRTKNEENKIEKVLQSIISQHTSEKIEVIIVDSGSKDRTLEIAQKYGCKIIKISPEDFTWGYALNIGIKNSIGDIIAVISGHCVLLNDECVENVRMSFDRNRDLSVLYGRQEGNIIDDPFEKYNNDKYYPNLNGIHYFNVEKQYTSTISNACCFFRKKVWENVKFDELIQSCEDAKWADEVDKAGFNLAYTGDIGVYHSHKLESTYLYKKSFWREFEMHTLRGENKGKSYYFLKFMIKHVLNDFVFWQKKLSSEIKINRIISYCYIVNLACYKASVLNKSNIKYDEIKVPKSVLNVGVTL